MYLEKIRIEKLEYSEKLQQRVSVFHQKDFLNLYSPYIYIVGIFNNNNEQTGFFYYFKKSKWGLKYIIPPPFHPYNGLVFYTEAEKEDRKNSFVKELHQLIISFFEKNENAQYIRFVMSPEMIDTQVFQWNKWRVKVSYTYHLNLNNSKEELFENLSSEKRRSIRKAQKDNIDVREEKDYSIIQKLVLKTFQRQNKRINSFYLSKIMEEWANEKNSFAYVAYYNQKPVAASFCVFDNHSAYYLFGGYDDENMHHGAGVSCIWHCILKSKSIGLKRFDFEGSMLPQVERYFRDFGGKLVPYYVCEKIKLF